MCVSVVKKVYDEPQPKEMWAYKVFDRNEFAGHRDSSYLFQYYSLPPHSKAVVEGRWLKARAGRVNLGRLSEYTSGFHAYAAKPNDDTGIIVRVKIRNVTCWGYEGTVKVYVAQEMFVPMSRSASKSAARAVKPVAKRKSAKRSK